jgi:hypothetical protein
MINDECVVQVAGFIIRHEISKEFHKFGDRCIH